MQRTLAEHKQQLQEMPIEQHKSRTIRIRTNQICKIIQIGTLVICRYVCLYSAGDARDISRDYGVQIGYKSFGNTSEP